jgi:16S rRNA A1518/A1519 N6-dimethyltransferase RsmA/KsgA/DIM1 with predicted DNA glycosylase/AP lyase activity
MKRFLYYANIPYHIANHVVGKQHTQQHRRTVGFFVMAAGVTIAHLAQHELNAILGLLGYLIGYSIHATGFMPYAHDIEQTILENQSKNQTK